MRLGATTAGMAREEQQRWHAPSRRARRGSGTQRRTRHTSHGTRTSILCIHDHCDSRLASPLRSTNPSPIPSPCQPGKRSRGASHEGGHWSGLRVIPVSLLESPRPGTDTLLVRPAPIPAHAQQSSRRPDQSATATPHLANPAAAAAPGSLGGDEAQKPPVHRLRAQAVRSFHPLAPPRASMASDEFGLLPSVLLWRFPLRVRGVLRTTTCFRFPGISVRCGAVFFYWIIFLEMRPEIPRACTRPLAIWSAPRIGGRVGV
jgi:hypothetical protein